METISTHFKRFRISRGFFLMCGLSLFLLISFTGVTLQAETAGVFVTEPVFNSRVYIEEQGKGNSPTIVLVHGSGHLGSTIWESSINELHDYFHVISFDLPGFGRSEKKAELYTPESYARFIKWVVDQYATSPVTLVGHSMGGAISLYFAGVYPQSLERLILVDVAGILHRATFTKNMLAGYFGGQLTIGETNLVEGPLSALKYLVNSTIETVDNRLVPDDLNPLLRSETFRKTALNGDPIQISGMALILTDFSSILNKVKVPTSIIWGENDAIAPLRAAILLACTIETSALKILTGTGHDPMLEDPETFNAILMESIMEPSLSLYPKITQRNAGSLELPDRSIGNQTDIHVKGDFNSISIKNSKGITVTDTISRKIVIENSEVTITNTMVNGDKTALEITNSIVYLTGVQASAQTTIRVYNSSLDIAGSSLKGSRNLIASDYKSTVVFSVSKVDSPDRQGFVHQNMRLYLGDTF